MTPSTWYREPTLNIIYTPPTKKKVVGHWWPLLLRPLFPRCYGRYCDFFQVFLSQALWLCPRILFSELTFVSEGMIRIMEFGKLAVIWKISNNSYSLVRKLIALQHSVKSVFQINFRFDQNVVQAVNPVPSLPCNNIAFEDRFIQGSVFFTQFI